VVVRYAVNILMFELAKYFSILKKLAFRKYIHWKETSWGWETSPDTWGPRTSGDPWRLHMVSVKIWQKN